MHYTKRIDQSKIAFRLQSNQSTTTVRLKLVPSLLLHGMWHITLTAVKGTMVVNGTTAVKGTMAVREIMAPFGGKISLFPLNWNLTLFNTAQNANRNFGADFT